ncbi:MAG: GWxTD domain-containing protein [Bacteroidetes bacterium]|nr:GWxTD domain-containing protein [Bacteroidota bacterium]
MTFEEKNDFTLNSVIELIEPVFEGIDEINNPQYVNNVINAYWQMSDPLFKKGINERLLEHYTRVAYANLHYSVPDMGIEGWKTDRGKTVLRYGIPRERKRLRPSKTEWGVSMKTEIWNYDDMFFAFTDQFSSGNYAYSAPTGEKSRFKSQYGGDSHTYAQNLLNIRHQDYRPPFYGEKLDLEYDIPQFRNIKNGKITDMVFTYSYEAHDSTVSRYDSLQNHLWSLEIFDNYFTNVFSAEQTANPDDVKVRKIDEYNLYQSTTLVSLAPDSGYLSFKIFRSNDKGFSTIIQPMRISEFSSDKLLVSDIIFASELSNNKFEYSLTRGDISLNPVSSQLLEKDGNLYIYYEIYNLSKNAGHLTDFKIDLNIHEAEGDGVFEGIGSLVNDALSILGGGSETSFNFSSQYQTVEQNPQMYLQLDLSELAADDYVLEIEIVDNNTGEINRSKIDFRLF